jgi:uncharacterized membrane protein
MDIFIHFLHIAAAMFWVGGHLFLAFILGPVARRQLPPPQRLPLTLAVAQRFKRFSHGALGVLLLSGLYHIRYVFLSSAGSFLGTSYGRLFTIKMGFLVLSLILSVLHDRKWGPALTKLSHAPDSPEFKTAARRMLFWARFNVVVTLALVACAAALRHISF